ncbi:hypothetical protein C8Q76DRAFT_798697 [Earliella scabrosa]|nr:hypothetical protein C8Q76DRAFT_798697 [Earliella scabrosa]
MSAVLDGLFHQLAQLQTSVYSDVASLALLVYDCQLTFGDEVNMIWMSDAKLSQLLFAAPATLADPIYPLHSCP